MIYRGRQSIALDRNSFPSPLTWLPSKRQSWGSSRVGNPSNLFEVRAREPRKSDKHSQLKCYTPMLGRIPSMLRHRFADCRKTFPCLRTSAKPTVEPATPIAHGWAFTMRTAPRLRAASGSVQEITRLIAILEISAPYANSCNFRCLFLAVHRVYVQLLF